MPILAVAFGVIWLCIAGTVLVVDESGAVTRAEQVTGAGTSPLHALPGGRFFGLPTNEGTVRLHCRNGTSKEIGYVSESLHLRIRVGRDCGDAREVP